MQTPQKFPPPLPASHRDPLEEKDLMDRFLGFRGNMGILATLVGLGLVFTVVSISAGLPAPALNGIIFLAAGAAYFWYVQLRPSWQEAEAHAEALRPLGRPATADERRLASNLLSLTRQRIDAYWKAPGGSVDNLPLLSQATEALNKARKLDPNATFKPTDKEAPSTLTVDMLAAEILYIESLALFTQAEVYKNAKPSDEDLLNYKEWKRNTERSAKYYYRRSLTPAHKAVVYAPLNTLYISQLCKALRACDFPAEAKICAQRAYELTPAAPHVVELML